MFKVGTLQHVKGFILDKLFEYGCLSSGGHHAKHMPVRDLRHGYPPRYHGIFARATGELRAEGLILLFKARTGRDSDWHAVLQKEKLRRARPLINGYRQSVKLHRYNRNFTGLL